MRFAGTWKQYSAKAMSQLITMTLNNGAWRYFRWPYQAKVMKMLERVRSRIVVMRICCLILGFDCTPQQWSDGRLARPVLWRPGGGARLSTINSGGFPRSPREWPATLHPSG